MIHLAALNNCAISSMRWSLGGDEVSCAFYFVGAWELFLSYSYPFGGCFGGAWREGVLMATMPPSYSCSDTVLVFVRGVAPR
ncbi:hypothetical protein K438DRAFT_1864301 [Mycena galopus ATCC 62051]|nr:hypothetical protein K438DRAFT_1864301 [Mycena galopus ATCC 62051]